MQNQGPGYIGIASNPAATFNRKFIGGVRIFEAFGGWETNFTDVQDTLPLVDLQMILNYSAPDNRCCIHVQTEYLVNLSMNLKLAVYVTEDSIIGYQKNNNAAIGTVPEIPNYVFMNVLRGSVNGTWGSDLSSGPVTAGTKTISSLKLIPAAGWVPEHLHIIAIVYNADNDEVLQVISEKMVP